MKYRLNHITRQIINEYYVRPEEWHVSLYATDMADIKKLPDIEQWCRQHPCASCIITARDGYLTFEEQQDYIMFSMTWAE